MKKNSIFTAEQKKRLNSLIGRFKKISPQQGAFYLLVALGIIGLLMMTFRPDPRIAKAAEQVPQLAADIRQKFQMRSDYRGLNTQEVLNLKAAPAEMLAGNGLMNALELPVLVGSGPEGATLMPGARNFDIIYTGLGKSECAGVAAYNIGEKNRLGLNYVTLITEDFEKTYSWGGENALPISPAEAKKACGRQNILIFGYE